METAEHPIIEQLSTLDYRYLIDYYPGFKNYVYKWCWCLCYKVKWPILSKILNTQQARTLKLDYTEKVFFKKKQ